MKLNLSEEPLVSLVVPGSTAAADHATSLAAGREPGRLRLSKEPMARCSHTAARWARAALGSLSQPDVV